MHHASPGRVSEGSLEIKALQQITPLREAATKVMIYMFINLSMLCYTNNKESSGVM